MKLKAWFVFFFILLITPLVYSRHAHAGQTEITVSAAASLTLPFKQLGKAFEAAYPEYQVIFNFGASGALLQQIEQGAPVDVFASADLFTMDQAQEKRLITPSSRVNFTRNALVVVVPVKASKTSQTPSVQITQLESLLAEQVQYIAIGNPKTTPNARYAKAILQAQGLWEALEHKFIYANNVRQSLQYVAQAEVEAGFVFASDAFQAKEQVQVALNFYTAPSSSFDMPEIIYPIAATRHTQQAQAAQDFIRFIMSEPGQRILQQQGFLPL